MTRGGARLHRRDRRQATALVLLLLLVVSGCARHRDRPSPSLLRPAATDSAQERWRPAPGVSWQWQLDGSLDSAVGAQVYDVDGFDTTAAQVAALHRAGRKVVCYLDIGAVEQDRPDTARFPSRVRGRGVDGWPQERYLDIRDPVVRSLMADRIEMCRAKGFDGVEGDLVDAYANPSGFPITTADEEDYLRWFAATSHTAGLAAGLKNDPDLAARLVGEFDFAIVEDCVAQQQCSAYRAFTRADRAVLDAEYSVPPDRYCPVTRPLGISAIGKRLDLGAWRTTCGAGDG